MKRSRSFIKGWSSRGISGGGGIGCWISCPGAPWGMPGSGGISGSAEGNQIPGEPLRMSQAVTGNLKLIIRRRKIKKKKVLSKGVACGSSFEIRLQIMTTETIRKSQMKERIRTSVSLIIGKCQGSLGTCSTGPKVRKNHSRTILLLSLGAKKIKRIVDTVRSEGKSLRIVLRFYGFLFRGQGPHGLPRHPCYSMRNCVSFKP